jgi:membrane peptidoglycan carboxypeptidase
MQEFAEQQHGQDGDRDDGGRGNRGRARGRARVRRTGYRRIVDYPRTGRRGWRCLVPSWRLVCGSLLGLALALAGTVVAVYETVQMPDIDHLRMPTATVYEYSDGTVFYAEGLQDRTPVPLSQVPETMQDAIVSIENPTFYTDAGIAPKGILRALVSDVEGGPFEGGSTITQQFVKNAYLTDNQTFSRKLVEIFEALKITSYYPKTEILDDYLNTVYFGRESYGIDAAAETYFGIPADQVTDPARAAYLAALVNEPTVLSATDPASQALLKARWNLVLDAMVKAGHLTPAQRRAVTWPTALQPAGSVVTDANGVDDSAMAQVANAYLDKLHAQDPAVPDSATADAGGDVIRTTFDRADMTAAVKAVDAGLLQKLHPGDPSQAAVDKGVQVGLASVDADTGELVAFYPGGSQYDNATQAQIEPGSQMSAFATASALSPGSAQTAPAGSDPSALWTLMSQVGLTQNLQADPYELPEPLAALKKDPQLDLGIAPESPARMAAAYAVFPDGGVYHELAMALTVTVNGRQVWSYHPQGSQALSPDSAAIVTAMLSDRSPGSAGSVSAEGGSTGSSGAGGVPPEYTAGEAGTIGGDRSVWYSGYTTDIVTTVGLWDQSVNAKGRTTELSLDHLGGLGATQSAVWPTRIWGDYMRSVTGGSAKAFPPPPAQAVAVVPSPAAGDQADGPELPYQPQAPGTPSGASPDSSAHAGAPAPGPGHPSGRPSGSPSGGTPGTPLPTFSLRSGPPDSGGPSPDASGSATGRP